MSKSKAVELYLLDIVVAEYNDYRPLPMHMQERRSISTARLLHHDYRTVSLRWSTGAELIDCS